MKGAGAVGGTRRRWRTWRRSSSRGTTFHNGSSSRAFGTTGGLCSLDGEVELAILVAANDTNDDLVPFFKELVDILDIGVTDLRDVNATYFIRVCLTERSERNDLDDNAFA